MLQVRLKDTLLDRQPHLVEGIGHYSCHVETAMLVFFNRCNSKANILDEMYKIIEILFKYILRSLIHLC